MAQRDERLRVLTLLAVGCAIQVLVSAGCESSALPGGDDDAGAQADDLAVSQAAPKDASTQPDLLCRPDCGNCCGKDDGCGQPCRCIPGDVCVAGTCCKPKCANEMGYDLCGGADDGCGGTCNKCPRNTDPCCGGLCCWALCGGKNDELCCGRCICRSPTGQQCIKKGCIVLPGEVCCGGSIVDGMCM